MVQTLTTNAANDIFLAPNGNLSISTGIEGVLQACATAAKMQLGEAVLATKEGVPNFETIWIGVPNYAIWESFLRRVLLKVEGVTEVVSLVIAREGNLMTYTATIKTAFGQGVING